MKLMIYLISDSTGITVETLSRSLLIQFADLDAEVQIFRYIDSMQKLDPVIEKLDRDAQDKDVTPIVFSSLAETALRTRLLKSGARVFDMMETFIPPLSDLLGKSPSQAIGRTHLPGYEQDYHDRMEAVNFALLHDDGASLQHYDRADVILTGVSRSGKTPTCVYLAMHYGIFAANYPLVEDELEAEKLPAFLIPYNQKLFGLTISPVRLQQIRQERRPNSQYASVNQCQYEVRQVEALLRQAGVDFLDVTHRSVEEIATTILQQAGLSSRFIRP